MRRRSSMSIFAHEPMVLPNGNSINVCFQQGERIISLALDDSCKGSGLLFRGSIELHRKPDKGSDDIELCTHEVFPEQGSIVVMATMENFKAAMEWVEKEDEIPPSANVWEDCEGHSQR